MTHNGWIIINKPLGGSSAQIVAAVKRQLGRENKVGHAGTLDPLATGVLPLAIGEATKLCQYLIDSDKIYEFEVSWGEERSTDDAEGEVVAKLLSYSVTELDILKAMESFKGKIEQMPPSYSALKIDGKRAYDLARAGKEVKLKPRNITIYDLELLNSETKQLSNSATFRVHCSKGTYVRSIARDLGRKLGCLGYVTRLHRVAHGQFHEKDAISLENFTKLCEKGNVSTCMLPVEEVLDGIPAFPLEDEEVAKIRNGIAITNRLELSGEVIALQKNGKLIAMAANSNGKLQPKRVFNH